MRAKEQIIEKIIEFKVPIEKNTKISDIEVNEKDTKRFLGGIKRKYRLMIIFFVFLQVILLFMVFPVIIIVFLHNL